MILLGKRAEGGHATMQIYRGKRECYDAEPQSARLLNSKRNSHMEVKSDSTSPAREIDPVKFQCYQDRSSRHSCSI